MTTLRVGNSLWVGVLALVMGVAAPLWAEDQPVENQVPPDFKPGVEQIAPAPSPALDAVDPLRLREIHGADKVYVDPQTGQANVYMKQDGTAVSKEEWADYMKQIGEKHKTDSRKWVNEAIGAERALNTDGKDDARVNGVVNGTLEAQQRLEQNIDAQQKQVEAEVRRVVPLRTLISDEAGKREVQGGAQEK